MRAAPQGSLTRADQINESARRYVDRHPKVAHAFVKFSLEAIDKGFKNYSVNAIFERIRWEFDEVDTNGQSTFKISNNHRAWFARKFMELYPQHEGFFRIRERRSKRQPPQTKPELQPKDFPYAEASEYRQDSRE